MKRRELIPGVCGWLDRVGEKDVVVAKLAGA
jgi:hypothetical protein